MTLAGAWQRLDRSGRNLLPAALTLAFVLLGAVPTRIDGLDAVMPLLSLCAVYFWTIYRPQLLPPALIFAVGLMQDALAGTLFGTHAVMLLLAYALVVSQRRFFLGKSFPLVWWGFMLIGVIVIVAGWLVSSMVSGTVLRPGPVTFQLLLTLALYPLATLILAGAQRLLPAPGAQP